MTEPEGESTRAERRRQHLADDLCKTEKALHDEEDNGARLGVLLSQNTDPIVEARLRKSIDLSARLVRGIGRGVLDLRAAIAEEHGG